MDIYLVEKLVGYIAIYTRKMNLFVYVNTVLHCIILESNFILLTQVSLIKYFFKMLYEVTA